LFSVAEKAIAEVRESRRWLLGLKGKPAKKRLKRRNTPTTRKIPD